MLKLSLRCFSLVPAMETWAKVLHFPTLLCLTEDCTGANIPRFTHQRQAETVTSRSDSELQVYCVEQNIMVRFWPDDYPIIGKKLKQQLAISTLVSSPVVHSELWQGPVHLQGSPSPLILPLSPNKQHVVVTVEYERCGLAYHWEHK